MADREHLAVLRGEDAAGEDDLGVVGELLNSNGACVHGRIFRVPLQLFHFNINEIIVPFLDSRISPRQRCTWSRPH